MCIRDRFKGVPTFDYEEKSLIDLLVDNKIVSSKREAREFFHSNAIKMCIRDRA